MKNYNDDIKISVVIPIHNRKEYISECLHSVLEQSINSLEIICIDDGSDQETKQFLQLFQAEYDDLRIESIEHMGAYAARNYGIKISKGKYLCFLDSDDYLADSECLEHIYEKAEENNAIVCAGGIVNVYLDGRKELRGYNYKYVGFHDCIKEPQISGHTRYIYNRKFLLDNNLLYFPFKRYEDPPFVLKTLISAGKVYVTERIMYCCRQYNRKRKYFDYDIVCDILKGIKECFKISGEFGLKELAEYDLMISIERIYAQISVYVYNNDNYIMMLLDEINNIIYESFGNYQETLTKKHIMDNVNDLLKIIRIIEKSEGIIVYGAGYVGKKLLRHLPRKTVNCFVVTSLDYKEESFIRGIPVYSFESIKAEKNQLFLIAAEKKNQKKFAENLEKYGFYNYYSLNSSDVDILDFIGTRSKNID